MSKKVKIILLSLLGIVVVLVVIALVTAPQPEGNSASQSDNNTPPADNSQPAAARSGTVDNPPPPPVFETSERVYEVISGGADFTYRVREVSSQKELDLFLPSDANITAGKRESITASTILTVQRFMELSNGVVATELSISTVE